MRDALSPGSRDRLQRWTAPAAAADRPVANARDYVDHERGIPSTYRHPRNRDPVIHSVQPTPYSWAFAIFAASLLAACIGLVVLTAWQLASIYGLNP
jgi:hypothetical protein